MKMNTTPLLLVLIQLTLSSCSEQVLSARTDNVSGDKQQLSQLDRQYRKMIPVFWNQVYPDGGRTLYCSKAFDGGYHKTINIEHVFPMSWVMKSLRCGDRKQCRRTSQRFRYIESDMHNMYPSLSEANKIRSAMAYGIIRGDRTYRLNSVKRCDFEVDFKKRRVEPQPASRGEIARAMLYMEDTYPELELFDRQRRMLLEWHEADPPDRHEKRRNAVIEELQGIRNRWIDR